MDILHLVKRRLKHLKRRLRTLQSYYGGVLHAEVNTH